MKFACSVFLVLLLASCGKRESRIEVIDDENLTQKQIDSVLDEYNFEYSNVVFIDSLQKLILPISTQKARDRSFKGSYYSGDYAYAQYWNFVFYDIPSGKSKLLTTKKTRISKFKTNLKKTGPILKNSVLYIIGDVDFDSDKQLTNDDPEQLFISDINGENYRSLSPVTEHLVKYRIVPDTDKLIFQTLRDTNQDKVFDVKDEAVWYLLDLSKDSGPLEILSSTQRKEIENLYFKQWLVKKKS